VDYGMGNLYSVQRACDHAGLRAVITAVPTDVLGADAVLIPGVGAMPDAMRALDASGLSDAIREQVARGTLVFGVCLGMQLLMSEGTEFGSHRGLGVVPGLVRRFDGLDDEGAPLKVPHIGWNAVRSRPDGTSWQGSPLETTPEGTYFYFVHSYYVVPEEADVGMAWTRYGDVTFCSAVASGNVFGCQFHPERSGPPGLGVYRQVAHLLAERLPAEPRGASS
jgi:glutamine amidotransferase